MLNQNETAYILASGSPRRKELLAYLGLPQTYQFVVETDETINKDWSPAEAVMRLAINKGTEVLSQLNNMKQDWLPRTTTIVLISADTIVVRDGEILGKPKNEDEAFSMLKSLQGRTHEVYTGLTLIKTQHSSVLTKGEHLVSFGKYINEHVLNELNGTVKLNGYGHIGEYLTIQGNEETKTEVNVGYTCSKVTFRPLNDSQIINYIITGDPMDKAGSYGIQGIGAVNIEAINGDFYSVMGLPLSLLHYFNTKSP